MRHGHVSSLATGARRGGGLLKPGTTAGAETATVCGEADDRVLRRLQEAPSRDRRPWSGRSDRGRRRPRCPHGATSRRVAELGKQVGSDSTKVFDDPMKRILERMPKGAAEVIRQIIPELADRMMEFCERNRDKYGL